MTLSLTCLPLIERELRIALRKKRPVRLRLVTASLCVGAVGVYLAWGRLLSPLLPGSTTGWGLHRLFCLAGVYLVLAAPAMVAGVFAEERREQTLGLLFLSGLSALEIFASKALSAALVAGTRLLALFPLLALPFLIGGVSWDLFIATILILPSLLLLALAITLLASVLTTDEGAAVALAAVVAVVLCGLPWAIHFTLGHLSAAPPSAWWLRLSPAYAPWLVWNGRAPRTEIGSCLGLMLLWSGVCLTQAVVVLKGLWREQTRGAGRAAWHERWRRLIHGGPRRRHALAARWLDANPFVWLAARDRQSTFLAWAVAGVIILGWLVCWGVWGARWLNLLNLLLSLAFLNAAFRWTLSYAAAKALAEPRRDGSFELLLTTMLETNDIVWGGFEALNVQFRQVARCLLAFEFVVLAAGLTLRTWTAAALFVYGVAATVVLIWLWPAARGWRPIPAAIPGVVTSLRLTTGWSRAMTAMWAGLNSGRPAFAAWRSAGTNHWMWILNLYNIYMFGHAFGGFARFPTGSPLQLKIAGGAAALLLLLFGLQFVDAKINPASDRLLGQFREVVREPLPDRDDPVFKQWNVSERLPRNRKVPWFLRRIW